MPHQGELRPVGVVHARPRELILISGLLLLVVSSLLGVTWLGIAAVSGVRAYITGEGLYSKAQKDAVQHLVHYAATGHERWYAAFLDAIAVPRADARARIALSAEPPQRELGAAALRQGRNHPDDVPTMILLFRHAHWLPEMEHGIAIWTEADALVDRLTQAAETLHAEIDSPAPSPQRVTSLLDEVAILNQRLGALEDEFSFALGEGARRIHRLVLGTSALASAALLVIAVLVTGRLLRRMRRHEERFRSMIEHGNDVITIVDAHATILYNSPALERVLGWGRNELIGRSAIEFLHPNDVGNVGAAIARVFADPGTPQSAEFRFRHKDGSWRNLASTGRALPAEGAKPTMVVSSRDITDQRRLEADLVQAQKMESIGRLAGGIAHDFNNLLTAILGSAEAARAQLVDGSTAREEIEEVVRSSERAAGLTRQLLAFARRQVIEPRVFDLQTAVREMERTLRRLAGADVVLVVEEGPGPTTVRADPSQIQQVLVNLVVNARDAMPGGGTLTLATRAVAPAEAESGRARVRLEVSDTGVAMSEDVRQRVFEPFFTTKGPGKGTGLGLATCYGIVTQTGGTIDVRSEAGRGTSFRIDLPYAEPELAAPVRPAPRPGPRGAGETVLLVEDEPAVRRIASLALRARGYRVIEAVDGEEGLRIAAETGDEIDLLLTDVMMPHLGGRELAEHLRGRRPALRVLFMSGYTDDAGLVRDVAATGIAFLQKPFAPDTLCRKVREVLDEKGAGEV